MPKSTKSNQSKSAKQAEVSSPVQGAEATSSALKSAKETASTHPAHPTASTQSTDNTYAHVAVLIPCYNESATIAKVVQDYRAALPGARVYVYDNNSTDDSAQLASAAGAIVRHESRQGKGNVIRSMFRQIDAECYLMVDADDTYPAEHARDLCQPILDNTADMTVGDRLSSTYFTENKRPFHNFGNRLVRLLINKLFHNNVKDIMTGYRAFSRTFVKSYPVLVKGFEIETEMTIHAVDKNFRILELPVSYRDRPEGSTSKLNTYSDGFRVLKTIAILFKEYKPAQFFNLLALLCLVVSLILAIPVFDEFFRTGLVLRFPTLIVAGFILMAGLLFFITGLILQVVVKKHRQLFELYLYRLEENQPVDKDRISAKHPASANTGDAPTSDSANTNSGSKK